MHLPQLGLGAGEPALDQLVEITGLGLSTSRNSAPWMWTPISTSRGSSGVPCRGSPSSGNHTFQSSAHSSRIFSPIARHRRQARHRHPLAVAVAVVGQVDVRILGEVGQLGRPVGADEPEVGAGRALLVGHRPRAQVPVGAARRHHRRVDVVDQLVEFLQLTRHGRLAPVLRRAGRPAQSTLALCTLTSAGFRTPGLVMRCRPLGRRVFPNGGIATALPISADS